MRYEEKLRKHLEELFERYAEDTGLKPYAISKTVAKDQNFHSRIAGGGGFTTALYDRVSANFAVIWPAGLPWPSDVPEPDQDAATINPTKD